MQCPKSENGIHAMTMGPNTVAEKLSKGEITMEDAIKSQFCIYCGKAIW